MAILTRTSANFKLTSTSELKKSLVTLGETVEVGQALYKDTDSKYYKLRSTSSLTPQSIVVAATAGDLDDSISILYEGAYEPGATLVVGELYCAAPTVNAGEYLPFSEVTSGEKIIYIGYATSTSVLQFFPLDTGVTKP